MSSIVLVCISVWRYVKKGEKLGRYPTSINNDSNAHFLETLAMTAYADLDTSIIDELPPGRTPVTTVVLPDSRRGDVIERVSQSCCRAKTPNILGVHTY